MADAALFNDNGTLVDPHPTTMAVAPGVLEMMRSMARNPSGIIPTEFKVLILPDPVEEITKGGIIRPVESTEKDKFATVCGRIVATAALAFTYATAAEWGDAKPKTGDRVLYAKYAGFRHKGRDGVEYVIVNDKDLVAVLA